MSIGPGVFRVQPVVVGFKQDPVRCCWVEPWDGPLWNTLYPWQYLATGTITNDPPAALTSPSISISDGVLDIEVYDTPPGGDWIGHQHYFYYNPDEPIRNSISNVLCDFTAGTYSGRYYEMGWLRVFLVCTVGAANVFFHLYLYASASLGLSLTNEWQQTYAGPGGTDYGRLLLLNTSDYITLPVEGAVLDYIGIEFWRDWIGGMPPGPDQISGDTFSINNLEVC